MIQDALIIETKLFHKAKNLAANYNKNSLKSKAIGTIFINDLLFLNFRLLKLNTPKI